MFKISFSAYATCLLLGGLLFASSSQAQIFCWRGYCNPPDELKTCSVPNGSGELQPNGVCLIKDCTTGYNLSDNLCVKITTTPTPPLVTSEVPWIPQALVSSAISKPLTDFGIYNGAGTNSGFFGSALVIIATASYSGNTTSDARLLQNLRYNISSGHDPSAAGGFSAQHELRFLVAATLAKSTDRIWSQLSDTEKSKIELVVRGLLVAGAYTSASNNPEIMKNVNRIKGLRANEVWWKGNPNFRSAGPALVVAARIYMGSDSAVTSYLNSFNKANFAKQLQTAGLKNMYETFRMDGPDGAMGARPSASQIEAGVKNYTWAINKKGVSDLQSHLAEIVNSTFSKPVAAGLNNGAGIVVNGVARARVMKNATALPNKGQIGMAHELDSSDAEGKRSAISYSFFGVRIALDLMTLMMCSGMMDPDSSVIKGLNSRANVGMTDLKFKTDNGYYSYSHGGSGANNETWTTNSHAVTWGLDYTFGQWFELLKIHLSK